MPKKHQVTLQRPVAVVLIGALLLSTGCTTMRPVRAATPNDPTYEQVRPGDTATQSSPEAGRDSHERISFVSGDVRSAAPKQSA
jgi:hypothetical protein